MLFPSLLNCALCKEFDDDDPEENDSYGEEPEEDTRGPRKKKRKKGNALLDLEAEEDDAEDDDDDEELGVRGLIADDDDVDGDVDRDKEQMRAQRFERERAMRNDDPEEMVRYFQDRFGDGNYADDDDEPGPPDIAGIDQQSLLPTIRDPRIWIVRCKKPGHERRAVFSLLQKSFNLKKRGIEIGIFSAIAPEHLKGRIYVEAFSAAQVEFAISGLELLTSYEGIKALPLEEMTDVLKAGKRPDKQVEGNWVRVTRGMYKGDLAQVCQVREGMNEGHIMIRMIPRLDLKGEKDYMEDMDDFVNEEDKEKVNGYRRKGRPPQKLFDKKELYRLTGSTDVYTQRDRQTGEVFEVWNEEQYRHGLLYKRMSVKTLTTGDAVQPQVDELEKWLAAETRMRMAFDDDPTSMDAEEASRGLGIDINAIAGKRNAKLFKGDTVRVTTGEQKGLTGTISSVDGDVVMLQIPEFPEPLRVARADVTKSFKVGDHIKVSSGKKAGYAGAIVAVDGDFLTVFTDSTREEIKVLSAQVADSSDINTDVGSQKRSAAQNRMQYELFDLVQMRADVNEKGVVIQVRNEGVTILTTQNQRRTVPVAAIKGKIRDSFVRATDSRGNPIAPNDTIHVTSGNLKDRQGIVKHIAGSTVFFKARDEINNCGMLAVIASNCTASTAAARQLTSTFRQSQANTFKMPAPIPRGSIASVGGRGGGRGGRAGGMGGGGRDPLLRKDVKIKSGQYKGYTGKVVDATERTVRVELSSKMKTITIDKKRVNPLNPEPGNNYGSSFQSSFGTGRGFRSPSGSGMGSRDSGRPTHPAQTPRNDLYRAQTPYGAQTPRYSATPRAGMTPRHNYGAMTPGRDDFRPGRTPSRADDYSGFGSFGRTPIPNTPGGEMANPYQQYPGHGPQTPATPAAAGIPSTPMGGPYAPEEPKLGIVEPNTPASYGGVEPRTPAPGGMEPATPAPGIVEPRTPAPGQEPRTPAPGVPQTPMVDPVTPHTPGIPQTPHTGEEDPAELGYRVLVDVEVLVKSQNNFSGVVTDAAVDGSFIKVRMFAGDQQNKEISVAGTDITPVQPRPEVSQKQELVKVLDGPSAGRVGRLQNVIPGPEDSLEGYIQFTNGEAATLNMSLVAKCSEGR